VVAVVNGYPIRTVVSHRVGTVFLVDGLGKGAATLERARALAAAAPPRTEGETDMQSKYPNVCVALVGEDENAFAILERVQRALREAGVPVAEVKAFTLEACSRDYYHLAGDRRADGRDDMSETERQKSQCN
jgi:hypothetical protein